MTPLLTELDLVIADDQFETVLAPSLYAYPFIEDANGFVAMTAVFERTQHKYGPRGYRYILLEAGHVAQNLASAAAELELGNTVRGGFSDSRLNAALGSTRDAPASCTASASAWRWTTPTCPPPTLGGRGSC